MRRLLLASPPLLAAIGALFLTLPIQAKDEQRSPHSATRAERTREFNVPAQAAATALLTFAKQAQIEVLFSVDAVRDARSTAVVGRFDPEDALSRLLQGTGFTARRNGDQKFIITRDTRPTGTIKGRLLTPAGRPARGARINLLETRHSAIANHDGEFELPSVAPGTYHLVARAKGFETLQLPDLAIEPQQVFTVGTKTLKPVGDPARLAPYLVKDRTTRSAPFDRSEAERGPRTAGSNLDLARTENDALPFNIYNRDQIARSGVVNLNEFLQREVLDSDAATTPPEQDLMAPTFAAGSTNLNLRGFGADQTIVLVNGRRLPEALIQNGPSSQTPDVNFIPLSLVQQVEVLPVSAASLYSGNAVGGIINIVLRPGVDAEANELTLTYTNALRGFDAPQSSASMMHARSLLGGALRVRVNASVTRTEPPTEAELGYRRRADPRTLPNTSSLYRATPNIRSLALQPEGPDSPPPTLPPLFGPGTPTVTSVPPGADGSGGLAVFRGREGVRNFAFFDPPGGLATSLDSIDYPYGREQTRLAYFASAVCDITPWLQVGIDGTYTRSVQHRGREVLAADLRLKAESPFNPFRQEAQVSLNETAPLLGPKHSEARLEFGAVVLSALFKLPAGWRLLVDSQYGQNVSKYRGLAGADAQRWQELVDEGRYNPLRDTQVFAPPSEFYDRVLIHRGGPGRFVTLGDYSTADAAIRVSHHALRLPTGSGALNAGVDYRRNYLANFNDERRYADGTLAADPIRYRGRSLERYSVFAEVQAPLLPKRWLPSWIRSLDGDFAVRYIASNNTDEAAVAPTFAFKAQLPAGFAFRGSASTSSRYPTPQMSRLGVSHPTSTGRISVDVKEAYDPVQKEKYRVQHDEVLDPYLMPEETITQTAGVIFRHGDVHRIRAAIDFVDTRKANEVINLDVQTILNLEHLFPERVVRLKEAGPNARVGDVHTVITGRINAAWRRSQNWNASVDYAWTKFPGGTLEAYGRVLYYSRYNHLLLTGANVIDELNHPEVGSPSLLKMRGKFGTSWSNRTGGFGVDGHYFHSRMLPEKEWPAQGRDRIRPFWQFDAFVQAEIGHLVKWLPDRMRAQVRVNNLFATEYARYASAGNGAGVQVYGDWRGRVYSLSLTTTF